MTLNLKTMPYVLIFHVLSRSMEGDSAFIPKKVNVYGNTLPNVATLSCLDFFLNFLTNYIEISNYIMGISFLGCFSIFNPSLTTVAF